MYPMLPMLEPVIKETHQERLKRAERARMAREFRSNDGEVPRVRARLGKLIMRAGARLASAEKPEIEDARFEKNAA